MSRNKASRDDFYDLSGPAGPAGITAYLRSRWQAAQGPALLGISFVMGALCLAAGVLGIGPAISAAEGHGTRGSFTARRYVCTGVQTRHCYWKGDFAASRSGPDTRADIEFKGHLPGNVHPGESVPAVDTGDQSEVFQPGNKTAWLGPVAFIVIGGAFVLGSAGIVVFRVRMRRWPKPIGR